MKSKESEPSSEPMAIDNHDKDGPSDASSSVVATATMDTMEASWTAKEISLSQVAAQIPNGSSIYIGSCGATPEATLQALVDDYRLADIQIIQMMPSGNLPHLKENVDRFRTSSYYSFAKTGFFNAENQKEGLKDYTPVGIHQIPRLLEEDRLHVDVAISK